MAKSVIGGFQKIPKKNKYREDEWSPEKSKKNKSKRERPSNKSPEDMFENDYEEDYEQKENYN